MADAHFLEDAKEVADAHPKQTVVVVHLALVDLVVAHLVPQLARVAPRAVPLVARAPRVTQTDEALGVLKVEKKGFL